MGQPLRVGIVGCGKIVAQYLDSLGKLSMVDVVAVADLDLARAQEVAGSLTGVQALSVDDLLATPDVGLVLNLTVPTAHAEIALKAIAAGKQVYGEKPLATNTPDAREVLEAARDAGIAIGCAPDAVLGTGIQTARKAVDDGVIGRPTSATATMVIPGHERWHPNPDYYYQPGGGPLLDMGPYYISTLVTLLGPIASVVGVSSRSRDERTIGTGPRAGETVPVAIDTHVTGVMVHASGAVSTLVMTFDAVATKSANIEIHGERGSLAVPNPNRFAGDVQVMALGDKEWTTLPVSAGYVDSGRGFGVADLVLTEAGGEPRAGGELAYHVLDVMESILESTSSGRTLSIGSTARRPAPVELTTLVPEAAVSA